jgi:hypothetical protein
VKVDLISLVYDALGRMVEQSWSSSHAQLVYDPLGRKLAIANNQNPWWVRVPLPGGGAAVYNPSLAYYSHPDWLGSHRFTSTPGRAMNRRVAQSIGGCRTLCAVISKGCGSFFPLPSPYRINLHKPRLPLFIERPTAPRPTLRMCHQLARHGVPVHVFQFFLSFPSSTR